MATRNPNELPYAPRPRGPRPLAEIEADLRRPVAAEFIEQKTKGGSRLDFIGWDFAWQTLQAYAPGVQKDVRLIISGDGQQVIVAAGVGVPTLDQGIVWRWATGQDEEDERAYGDAADRGEARALKRAAALFGLFMRQGYEKKGPVFPWDVPFLGISGGPAEPSSHPPVNAGVSALPPPTPERAPTPIRQPATVAPTNGHAPVAKPPAPPRPGADDPASPGQLKAISILFTKRQMDAAAQTAALGDRAAEELTFSEAAELIHALQ